MVFVGDPQKKIVLEMDADTFSLNNINYLYGKKDIKRRILNSRGWEIIFLNKKKWKLGENEQGLTFVKEKLEQFEKKRAAEKINY